MKVLVATESRHGATDEIAETIADVLRRYGHDVEVHRPDDVASAAPYDAFVLGSAIYMNAWLAPARRFVESHHELLATRPTWLFSSGPLARPSGDPVETPPEVERLSTLVGARDHHLFGGRLDPQNLKLGERVIAKLARVQNGDFREWEGVVAWATAIGRTLAESPQSVARLA
jgi:menaquinone-dependent protoporphyrinogen oxidase